MSEFNITTFFIGAATAYYCVNAFYMLMTKDRSRLRTVLGVIFIWWALFNAKDLLIANQESYTQPMLNAIIVVDGWSAITYACFLFELTSPGWVTPLRVLKMMVPFAVLSALYVVFPVKPLLTIYMTFLGFFGVVVLILGYRRRGRYVAYLQRQFSDIEKIDLSWIKNIYIIGFASQLLWVVISNIKLPIADAVYYVSTIPMWQMTIHYCSNLRQFRPATKPVLAMPSSQNPQRIYSFGGVLERIVLEEKLYLDPKISVNQLAARLSTNRTYVSDYLHSLSGTSFYDYINSLRIELKALPLMRERPEYTLEYVARESGFNSISTFRRAFVKHVGYNPSEFKRDGAAPTVAQKSAAAGETLAAVAGEA